MATATATQPSIDSSAFNLSEITYVDAADISLYQECPPELYVRGVQTADQVANKKTELVFDTTSGRVCTVITPFVVWQDEANIFILEGNTRRRAIVEMMNDTKFSDVGYDPIPVRFLDKPPTLETAIALQVSFNDTTSPHSLVQLAKRTVEMWDEYQARFVKEGLTAAKANGKATKTLQTILKKSEAYIGQLRKVGSQPAWYLEQIEAGVMNLDLALKMVRIADDNGLALEVVLQGVKGYVPSSEFKILQKHVDAFKKTLKNPTIDPENDEPENENAADPENTDPDPVKPPKFTRSESLEMVTNMAAFLDELGYQDQPEYKEHYAAIITVMSKYVSTVITKQFQPVTKQREIFEAFLAFTKLLGVEFLADLNDSELSNLAVIVNGANKPANSVLSLIAAELDDEESDDDDDLDDEESDDEEFIEG